MKTPSRLWADATGRQWRISVRTLSDGTGASRLSFVEQGAWPPRVRSVHMPEGKTLETLTDTELEQLKPRPKDLNEETA